MGTVDKQGVVTMQELLVSSLAQTDALVKIGVFPIWRAWSSKNILPKAHTGKWKVVVSTVGEASEVLCVAHFVVK